MAKNKRQTGNQTARPPADQPSVLRRHARIWLATLSTVVGVATGMFTLRDQVFPGEAGSAGAVSVPAYQQQVGRICDQMNDNDRSRAHEDTTLKAALYRADTTIAQRNALLDPVRRTVSRDGHELAVFAALETPKALASARRNTETAWNRNLARLRDYALRLDRIRTRTDLLAAIDHLSKLRPLLASDGVTLASGLERLGAANCDLRPPRVTATITLPSPRTQRLADRDHHAGTSGAGARGTKERGQGRTAGSANTPGSGSSGPGADASTRSANTPGSGSSGPGADASTRSADKPRLGSSHGPWPLSGKFTVNTPSSGATIRG
jgi:hypothetical protein